MVSYLRWELPGNLDPVTRVALERFNALALAGHLYIKIATRCLEAVHSLQRYDILSREKDPNAKTLLDSAGGNHLMTSHEIQLDLCKACAQETIKVIEEIVICTTC